MRFHSIEIVQIRPLGEDIFWRLTIEEMSRFFGRHKTSDWQKVAYQFILRDAIIATEKGFLKITEGLWCVSIRITMRAWWWPLVWREHKVERLMVKWDDLRTKRTLRTSIDRVVGEALSKTFTRGEFVPNSEFKGWS